MAPTLPAVDIGESGMPGANGLVTPAEGDLLGADVAGAGDVPVGHGWSSAAAAADGRSGLEAAARAVSMAASSREPLDQQS
jgi:hypothetical protein